MPLYEYQCDACGTRFERIRKFADPPLTECPNCGAGPVQKLVSSPAFHLKGSGWYATDYAKKPAESKTETKTETKTEAAKESTAAATDKPSGASSTPPATAAKDKP